METQGHKVSTGRALSRVLQEQRRMEKTSSLLLQGAGAEGRESPFNSLGPQIEKEEQGWAEEVKRQEESCQYWSKVLTQGH